MLINTANQEVIYATRRLVFYFYTSVINFFQVQDMIRNGEMLVIVDNTNTKIWELKPYVEMVNKILLLFKQNNALNIHKYTQMQHK